jgi:hypothetical protein
MAAAHARNPFDDLPDSLVTAILLRQLPTRSERVRVEGVCTRWLTLLRAPALWSELDSDEALDDVDERRSMRLSGLAPAVLLHAYAAHVPGALRSLRVAALHDTFVDTSHLVETLAAHTAARLGAPAGTPLAARASLLVEERAWLERVTLDFELPPDDVTLLADVLSEAHAPRLRDLFFTISLYHMEAAPLQALFALPLGRACAATLSVDGSLMYRDADESEDARLARLARFMADLAAALSGCGWRAVTLCVAETGWWREYEDVYGGNRASLTRSQLHMLLLAFVRALAPASCDVELQLVVYYVEAHVPHLRWSDNDVASLVAAVAAPRVRVTMVSE